MGRLAASVKFLSHDIGKLVLEKLRKGSEARLAVAFFNPRDHMLGALAGIKKLKLVISEEFTVNNPYKLERLEKAELRSIPTDDARGKLHAKVLVIKMPDGSDWILLGSANFTSAGMFSNQEACLVLESTNPADEKAAGEISVWFDSLFQNAPLLKLEQAKLIFDAQSQYCLVPRISKIGAPNVGYWALKTTEGPNGKSHWSMFKEEKAIAIGW